MTARRRTCAADHRPKTAPNAMMADWPQGRSPSDEPHDNRRLLVSAERLVTGAVLGWTARVRALITTTGLTVVTARKAGAELKRHRRPGPDERYLWVSALAQGTSRMARRRWGRPRPPRR